jgi:glutamine phosphoribosylpyrophosphate amidotransferase
MDGITGLYSPGDKELVEKIFLATGAVQHRGKASAGLAVGGPKGIYLHKDVGGIVDVADEEILRIFQDLEPVAAIGNVGYTKNKIPEKRNAEPILVKPKVDSRYSVVLTMNGRILESEVLTPSIPSTPPRSWGRCCTAASKKKGSPSRPAGGWWTSCMVAGPSP